ncbi:MAG: alpha/beta hydrolase-fold protein [Deinococcales bacterium]
MHWCARKVVVLCAILALAIPAFAARGTVVEVTVHGSSLEGNLSGTSPDRTVAIYLPADYTQDTAVRYPVLYLINGNIGDNRTWLDIWNVDEAADTLIASGAIQPLIIVMPDARNAYPANLYVNSPVTGNWEDFIANDLIGYVDTHYRTIAGPEDRAIAGHGMGGFGALSIATKHPETFRVVYAMSPWPIGMQETEFSMLSPFDFLVAAAAVSSEAPPSAYPELAAMAAFLSPNPDKPPGYIDLPYERVDNQPHRIDAVWNEWLAHTPLAMIRAHANDLRRYNGIAFDVGTLDTEDMLIDTQAYSEALTRAGIPHRFDVFAGGHLDRVKARLQAVVLPYVSQKLAAPGPQGASAQ